MVSNYFKIVVRNTKKHPLYVLINIFGLAVGMAVSILILLFVKHELSYDGYHKNADRIVRVSRAWFNQDGEISLHLGHAAPPFALLIQSDYGDDVEQAVRFFNFNPLIRYNQEAFVEERFFFADPEIFEVFSWELLEGNANDLGEFSDAIILTESMAKKYFGNENPIGKSLELELVGQKVPFQILWLNPNQFYIFFKFLTFDSTKRRLQSIRCTEVYLVRSCNGSAFFAPQKDQKKA